MADIKSPAERSRNMRAIRSRDTKPEVYLRKLLFARGLRYRKNVRHIPGHPDMYLAKYRAAIFVHGCFWHRHEGCRYGTSFYSFSVKMLLQRSQMYFQISPSCEHSLRALKPQYGQFTVQLALKKCVISGLLFFIYSLCNIKTSLVVSPRRIKQQDDTTL